MLHYNKLFFLINQFCCFGEVLIDFRYTDYIWGLIIILPYNLCILPSVTLYNLSDLYICPIPLWFISGSYHVFNYFFFSFIPFINKVVIFYYGLYFISVNINFNSTRPSVRENIYMSLMTSLLPKQVFLLLLRLLPGILHP